MRITLLCRHPLRVAAGFFALGDLPKYYNESIYQYA